MQTPLWFAALAVIAAALSPSSAQADIYTDNASDPAYASGAYAGMNGGTGFTAFSVSAVNGKPPYSGTFVGDASGSEGNSGTPAPASINTVGSKAFGCYANGGTTASVSVNRGFTHSLTTKGDSFSLDFVTGYNDGSGGVIGTVGVSLTSDDQKVGTFQYTEQGSASGYSFSGASTNLTFLPGAIHITYTLLSATTLQVQTTGAIAYTGTTTISGPITGFSVFETNSGGDKGLHNALFNNLVVTTNAGLPLDPEKAEMLLAQKLIGHSEYVNTLAFSPDGKTLASGSRDKTVRLWDTTTGIQKTLLWKHEAFTGSVTFSPDGRTLASGGWDDKIHLFDLGNGDEISEGKFNKNTNYILSLAFSPNGRRLASGSNDKTARIFSVATGTALSTPALPDAVASVVFSPDGKRLAGACLDGSVYVWDASNMHLLKKLTPQKGDASLFSVVFIDNDTLAAAGKSGVVDVWTLSTGEPVAALAAGSSAIYSLAFSARKHLLAAGGTDKIVRLWRWDAICGAQGGTVAPAATAAGHTATIRTIVFSPNGDQLATAGWDYNIFVWRVRGGTP